jgi:hypothetical protein
MSGDQYGLLKDKIIKIKEKNSTSTTIESFDKDDKIKKMMNEKKKNNMYIENVVKSRNIFVVYDLRHMGGTRKYIYDLLNTYSNMCIIYSKDHMKYIRNKKDIIWINHFIYTDITIIDILQKKKETNCKIYITIHDFTWLCNKIYEYNGQDPHGHNAYLFNNTISKEIKELFDLADKIIHPSRFTYDIYKKYFNEKNFVITEHDDYYCAKIIPKFNTLGNTINVGVLSALSTYKGQSQVDFLKEKYKKFMGYHINFCICGVSVPMYNDNYDSYRNLLLKYNVHCLLFLNIWGETWCYSLTKALLTGLPILYNNLGVFKERIQQSQHYFTVYESEKEINKDVNKKKLSLEFENMLSYIINNKISDLEMFNNNLVKTSNYSNILTKKTVDLNKYYKYIVVINSVINTSNYKLGYCESRSKYDGTERFLQTVETIYSIKKFMGNDVLIVFNESSNIDIITKQIIENLVDLFIDLAEYDDIYQDCQINLNKGISECKQMMKCLEIIDKTNIKFDHLFKISARYSLTSDFNLNEFDNSSNNFKRVPDKCFFREKVPSCYTFFYKIYHKNMNEYKIALSKTVSYLEDKLKKNEHISLETVLPFNLQNNVYVSTLGICGKVGPTGQIIIA